MNGSSRAQRRYISNAANAHAFMVGCKTNPAAGNKGISVIIVEADRPGFRRGRSLKKMGSNAGDTGEALLRFSARAREQSHRESRTTASGSC